MTDDRARLIAVREKEDSPNHSATLPDLHYRELEILYRRGFDVAPEKIDQLLDLPDGTLIADFETILKDSLDRTAYFKRLSR